MSDLRASSVNAESIGTGRQPVLLSIDASVLRRPVGIEVVRRLVHEGVELECLDAAALSRENLFDEAFDDMLAGLAELPRTDAEPDGFFVRTGVMDGHPWRLNGQIHELDERIWRVDLRGECPFAAMEDVLRLLGWPQSPVLFQPARLGLTLSEEDFRRVARASAAGR